MIVETLTTENVFELQHKLEKELEARKFVVSFISRFTPTSWGSSSIAGYICEDYPISLSKLLEISHQSQSIEELRQVGIYVNQRLGNSLRERWDGKEPLFFYRVKDGLGTPRIDDIELLEPTYQIKGGERYWVSKVDSMAVVQEREKRRRKRD